MLPRQIDLLLKEEQGVAHLRQFAIVGQLPEFAFPGSYILELYLLPKGPEQTPVHVINTISVLGRGDPERCAACRDRRAAGSYVRGYMDLEPRIILYLLSQLDADQRVAITELNHLVALIQESFGMRLVKPDGTKLAACGPHSGTRNAPMDEAKVPKLTLCSHVVNFKPEDATSPVKWDQCVTYGTYREADGWNMF